MNIYKELENPQLAKRLMELFCEVDLDWICDSMQYDEKEKAYCEEHCKYSHGCDMEECVVRYIKMQFRHEGKAV